MIKCFCNLIEQDHILVNHLVMQRHPFLETNQLIFHSELLLTRPYYF